MPGTRKDRDRRRQRDEGRVERAPQRETPTEPRSRIGRLIHKAWWLHSFGALAFGVGVMLFARKGLAHADKLLIVLAASWLLVFLALRFIVGPTNTRPDDKLAKKGLRVVTNYVIKNLYQQMFFFLVPLYASSATWSLSSTNWWIVPVLLACAVLSTMDLVFDNFIMQRRAVAATMYGVCLFGVLNLMLPLVTNLNHFGALLVAAGLTAPSVAFLTFRLRSVFTSRGVGLVVLSTVILLAMAWYGRASIPPAPLAMSRGAVGHGAPGAYETVPGKSERIKRTELDDLRCVALLTDPGRLGDEIVHRWQQDGVERLVAENLVAIETHRARGYLFRSYLRNPPADPLGTWTCTIETGSGQLVGRLEFEVVP